MHGNDVVIIVHRVENWGWGLSMSLVIHACRPSTLLVFDHIAVYSPTVPRKEKKGKERKRVKETSAEKNLFRSLTA